MSRRWIVAWLVGILIIIAFYVLFLRNMIVMAYQDAAPEWFTNLVNGFYPRFIVEKSRFNLPFFLSKTDQIILRFSLINLLLMVYLFYYYHFDAFTQKIHNFWQKQITIRQANWVSALFFLSMILFSSGFYSYLHDLAKVAVFYKPILLLKIFHIPFPSSKAILLLHTILILSCICVIAGVKPVFASVIAAILFLLFQAWLFSFEKIDHTFATFNYAAILMPFVLYEREKAVKEKSQFQPGWPLQLICLCIGLVYLMSGLEKVLISGIDWISADSFRSYIFLHQAPLGMWVAQSEWLSRLLPAIALLFQLGFITIVFYPKLRIVFLLMGVAFHAGTYLLFEVGWYIGPWIFVYLFFINWDRLSKLFNLSQFGQKIFRRKKAQF